jgi:exosortase
MTAVQNRPFWERLSWLILLVCIWFPVLYLLGAQWSLFEQYQYGWAVPFLCLYLAAQKRPTLPPITAPRLKKPAVVFLLLAGIVFWVMRVFQEANPLWRAASYGLAISAVTMTLLVVYLTQGIDRTVHHVFPVAFFLIAVPWPTPLEHWIIQTLTGLNANLVVELLNLVGVPALLHGNVIETSAGMVGIDEACSGIRSFQATLMIALFFGEFYQLRGGRRWGLLAAGPGLALGFNLARTLVLVLVAAKAGLPAMGRWHDPTGVILLVGCFVSLWGVAVWLAQDRKRIKTEKENSTSSIEFAVLNEPKPAFNVSILVPWFLIWASTVGISTEAWFRIHEAHGNRSYSWSTRWPVENTTLHTNIIPQNSLRILQCDQNSTASWTGEDGVFWQVFFLRWNAADSFYGRAKEAISKFHNPTDCLSAAGMKLEAQLDPVSIAVRPGLSLVFNRYVFSTGGKELYVFFSQTEDMTSGSQASSRMTHLSRLNAVLAGSRNYGQNNFEVALAGPENPAVALQIFRTQMPTLIQAETSDH